MTRVGIALQPVPVPRHVYDRLIAALRDCERQPLPVDTRDRVQAAIGLALVEVKLPSEFAR